MKTWQQKLSLLLALQLLLVAGVFVLNKNALPSRAAQPLMAESSSALDKLVFSDANSSVTLNKKAGSWQLADLYQLPAEQSKVAQVLAELGDTKLTWPVATTANSHSRFEVDNKKFQRHIQAYKGDKLVADIYLGSSPGFKKIHLRRASDEDVYVAELSQYDFAVKASDWLSKDLLKASDITQVSGADFTLERSSANKEAGQKAGQKAGDSWSFTKLDLAEGQVAPQVDASKAQALLGDFAAINVLDAVKKPPQGQSLSFSVISPQGNWQYEFVKADKNYYLKRSDRDIYFKINQSDYDKFARQNLAELSARAAEVSTSEADAKDKGQAVPNAKLAPVAKPSVAKLTSQTATPGAN